MSQLIKNLENKVSESVSKHGILGLGLVPGTLVFDARKYVKNYQDITKAQKIETYATLALVESTKIGVYLGIAYEILKNF